MPSQVGKPASRATGKDRKRGGRPEEGRERDCYKGSHAPARERKQRLRTKVWASRVLMGNPG